MDREGESVSGASFGIGALPNCFHPFINLEETYTTLDWAGVHRSKDPGAGAFTPYHNRKTFAYDDIPAGYVFVSKHNVLFHFHTKLFSLTFCCQKNGIVRGLWIKLFPIP